MRNISLLATSFAAVLATACTDENLISSTTSSIAGVCEAWEADGLDHTIANNHKLYRFSLDNCVTVTDASCPAPPPPPGGGSGTDTTPPPPVLDPPLPPDPGMDGKPSGNLYLLSAPVPEVRLKITSITSNESLDVCHSGDHSTSFDARIVDETHFELRGTIRSSYHDRVYHVNFVDQDGVEGSCTYIVPHSSGCGN